jgi:hypothetical protein
MRPMARRPTHLVEMDEGVPDSAGGPSRVTCHRCCRPSPAPTPSKGRVSRHLEEKATFVDAVPYPNSTMGAVHRSPPTHRFPRPSASQLESGADSPGREGSGFREFSLLVTFPFSITVSHGGSTPIPAIMHGPPRSAEREGSFSLASRSPGSELLPTFARARCSTNRPPGRSPLEMSGPSSE